eukprot:CAMPEP_0114528550 /NCGR_PEP_ID=MMETSP0109-20121206/24291_1 /TAXON_ID=29199 /ORGANISM="Chlorarachnion reptans, Strain CCCM449" /LENGTH=480 /DNA_ID=CAMNT_0001710753 /DNA_START=36 /DNA_END=1475 /DNA_ORIENTATION=+
MGGHGGLNILHHKSWNVYGKRQRKKVKEDEAKHLVEEKERRKERERKETQERLAVMRKRARNRRHAPDAAPIGDFTTSSTSVPDSEDEESDYDQESSFNSRLLHRPVATVPVATGVKFMVSEETEGEEEAQGGDEEDSLKHPRSQSGRGTSKVDEASQPMKHVDLFVDDVTKLQKTGKNAKREEEKKQEDLRALRRIHPTIFFSEAGHKAANPWYVRRSVGKPNDDSVGDMGGNSFKIVGVDKASRALIEKSKWGNKTKIMEERSETLKEHSKSWNDPLAMIHSSLGKKPKVKYLVKREGQRKPDWRCPSCGVTVFGRNAKCFKCKAPRPVDQKADEKILKRKFREGDWICPDPSCAHHNFKDNKRCFKCGMTPDEMINVFGSEKADPGQKRKGGEDLNAAEEVRPRKKHRKESKKEKKKKDKDRRKHAKKKKKKKTKRKRSSSSGSSSDSSSENETPKVLSVEQLRQQRLDRERQERKK